MINPQQQHGSGKGTATPPVASSFRIVVSCPEGREESHDLSGGNNLIVGSSPNCSIRLNDSGVAAMHCLIRLHQGRLSVQDWYTTAGTFLNGRKVEQPTEFGPGDEIRIGDFRLRAEVQSAAFASSHSGSSSPPQTALKSHGPDPALPTSTEEKAPALAAGRLTSPADYDAASAGNTPSSESIPEALTGHATTEKPESTETGRGETAESSLSDVTADSSGLSPRDEDLALLQLRIEELEAENEHLRQMQSPWDHASSAFHADPADLELLDLLKTEVEQLQEELSRKDAQLTELSAAGNVDTTDEEFSDPQVEKLVSRLEQLLDELQRSDERIALLEELVQTAEEAVHAEQQERQQLAAWVSDIETRIVQRESEWQAREEVLQKQIEELREERRRNEERLREMARRHASSAQARLIADLQQRIADLESQLKTVEESRESLRKVIDSVEFQRTVEGQKRRVEELLRAERLQLAEEHAQLARERAELARLKTQRQKSSDAPQRIDEATCRVRAFREHLKEIHAQEAATQSSGGLSSRLAKLWKRLENW